MTIFLQILAAVSGLAVILFVPGLIFWATFGGGMMRNDLRNQKFNRDDFR